LEITTHNNNNNNNNTNILISNFNLYVVILPSRNNIWFVYLTWENVEGRYIYISETSTQLYNI